jgi:transposase-like protein
MKGMHFPLHIIVIVFTLYFLNNRTIRTIPHFIHTTANIKVSHVIIASWTHKFAPLFKQKANFYKGQQNLQSDD